MNVTIITDASFCPDLKVAGYGYWIACGRRKFGGQGAFKGQVKDNNIAEAYAIINAIWIGIQKQVIQKGDRLLIQTDCIPAIQHLKTKRDGKIFERFIDIINSNDLKFEFRHVKGHTRKEGARYVTNRLCDKRAKEEMNKARQRYRLSELKEIVK